MPLPLRPALVDETLRIVPRRYRVPATPALTPDPRNGHAATALAVTIEQARQALVRHARPNGALKSVFIDALAQLIRDAMKGVADGPAMNGGASDLAMEGSAGAPAMKGVAGDAAIKGGAGDPAIQAMELRHRAAAVREYASLSASAEADRREVLAAVNALAHPAKRERMPAGALRDALDAVYAAGSSGRWVTLAHAMQALCALPESARDDAITRVCTQLAERPALSRLQRLDALASDTLVQRYQALCDRNGPRPGSATALRQGSDAQQRGAAVEAQAMQALQALAQRLNQAHIDSQAGADKRAAPGGPATPAHQTPSFPNAEDRDAPYRVVTSMRVPPSLPGSADRAKSEWDAALLQRADLADGAGTHPAWNIVLLVEAKASADAASTDLPRLLRGLQLLAQADANTVYPFKTQQGVVGLCGASLRALPTQGPDLAHAVLYCCDAPVDATPRLLNAASRMQLLSAPASIAYASQIAQQQPATAESLEPVWHALLDSPQWAGVLNQYPQLHQVRALMVHTDDLLAAAQHA